MMIFQRALKYQYIVFSIAMIASTICHASLFRPTSHPLHEFKQYAKKVHTLVLEASSKTTTRIVQEIKQILEENHQYLRVVVVPSNQDPIERISYINQLHPQLYLHLSLSSTPNKLMTYDTYYLLYDPLDIGSKKSTSGLSFPLIAKSYQNGLHETIALAQKFTHTLQDASKTTMINSPLGAPIKPLIGLTIPALALEITAHTEDTEKIIVQKIINAIEQSLTLIEPH